MSGIAALSLIGDGVQDGANGIALMQDINEQKRVQKEQRSLYRRELADKHRQQKIDNAFASRRAKLQERDLSFQKDLFKDEKKLQMSDFEEAQKQSRLESSSRIQEKRTQLNPAIGFHSNQRQLRGL